MLTNTSYINEYKDIIDFMTFIESTDNEVSKSVTKYNLIKKEAGVKLFFESSTKEEYLLFCEQEEESVLAKIGNAIKAMIEKFIAFFQKIFSNFKDIFTDVDRDKKIVEKMINQNPAIGKEVVTGLKNEWFTYGDVAKYNKDMMGLYNMLIEKRVEHTSVTEQIENIEMEYKRKENKLLKLGATVMGIVGAVSAILTIMDTVDKCKARIAQADQFLLSKGIDVRKVGDNVEVASAQAAEKVMSRLLAFNSQVSTNAKNGLSAAKSTFSSIISKHGKKEKN